MGMVFALLIDLYIAAVVLHCLLGATRLQVEPGMRAKLYSLVEPLLGSIRSTIRPSLNGVDLSGISAVALLLILRLVVLTLLT